MTTTVKATIDLQFHPKGEFYSYHKPPTGDVEAETLKHVLEICGRLGRSFDLLFNEDFRQTHWTGDMDLRVEDDGHVTVANLEAAVKTVFDAAAITRGQLKAMRLELAPDVVFASSQAKFPQTAETMAGPDDEEVLSFKAVSGSTVMRNYYSNPETGQVICCGLMPLQINDKPLLLAHPGVTTSRVEVVVGVHFPVKEA